MDYGDTLAWLYGLQKFGIKLGLDNIRVLLRRLGDPHERFASVHVAGTNGKGSVCAYLDAVLRKAGYRVGLYTSPHLVRFSERIQLNGQPISDDELVGLAGRVREVVEGMMREDPTRHPTFFEATTALAFLYFREQGVEIAVVEVGMGGRLDATNLLRPLVTVITRLGLEHTEYLGDTIEKIAAEKAGIVKTGVPCVSLAQEGVEVVKARCRDLGSPLTLVHRDLRVRRISHGPAGQRFRVRGAKEYTLDTALLGNYQPENATLALGALEALTRQGWRVPLSALRSGVSSASWPARMEVVSHHPLTVLDCTHTADGARRLRESVEETFRYDHLILVMGVLKDKDLRGMLTHLGPLASSAFAVQPDTERAFPAELIAKGLRRYVKEVRIMPSVGQGVSGAMGEAGPRDLVLITGSLYTAGEAMDHLRRRREARIAETLEKLQALHMPGEFPGDFPATTLAKVRAETQDPFVVLISTILSQRTRDPVTEAATRRLFTRYRDAQALARAPLKSIEALIKPVNFYPTKARGIRRVAKVIVEDHEGRVPRTYPELLALPLVGRKTAGCVMVYGFGEPHAGIPVDVHVHRIATQRLRWVTSETPEETEQQLMKLVPKEYWLSLNEILVRHGQTICLPRSPHCSRCPVTSLCDFYQERVSEGEARSGIQFAPV